MELVVFFGKLFKGDFMDTHCKNCNCDKNIIEALQQEMNINGYISDEAVIKISKQINKPVAQIYGVLTFYAQFRRTKRAKYNIEVCTGTACFVLGANVILNKILQKLNVTEGQISSDEKWIVNTCRCLGCCGLAPAITINGEVYGKLKPEDIDKILDSFN